MSISKFLGLGSRIVAFPYRSYTNVSPSQHESPGAAGAPAPDATPPLVDSFGRRHNYLRISLTERCNLRCQYCMPAEGVPLSARAALLTAEEVARVVRVMVRAGVDKVRLTGGEPTLRRDLADVVRALRDAGVGSVAITTNGLVLTRRLPALQRAGLTAINVSLDSLRPERYEHMARRPGLARVLAGVDLALQLGYRPVKINVVLMKGFNDDEICDFVEYTRTREVEVRFIEFMPFSGNKWDDSKLVPYRAALRQVFQRFPDAAPAPPRRNDTATVWRVPGFAGSVGFIHSMTEHFCSSCNRLRLTADGNLKVCLFGAAEVSLRDAMRGGAGDAALDALVRTALSNKKAKHAARGTSAAPPRWRAVRGYVTSVRHYCSGAPADDERGALSHLDARGRARMVDVGDKDATRRVAVASCELHVSAHLLRLLRSAKVPKGDALTVAQLAGTLGAKRTADLIPLCHPVALDCVRVTVELPQEEAEGGGGAVRVECEARVTARTGVEMEALTGAAVAALTLYDMCKAADRGMRVTELRLERKSGGRGGDYHRPASPTPHC